MRTPSHTAVIVNVAVLFISFGGIALARTPAAHQKPTWLWVMDANTNIGIVGRIRDSHKGGEPGWTAHYKTGRAGRVLVDRRLPNRLLFRVTLNGRELPVEPGSREGDVPYPGAAEKVLRVMINVRSGTTTHHGGGEWSSSSPTLFRAYVQDKEARQLLSEVEIKAVFSGVTTRSGSDGLFTIEIPASFRLDKPPSLATETLVFTKPGYKAFEYRSLVLQPGVTTLDVLLQKDAGTLVRENRSLTNMGNSFQDEFFESSVATPMPRRHFGEIISLEISPSTYDGGWIIYKKGAKAIVKARNLADVDIERFPTGTGVTSSVSAGAMQKVRSSPEEDTWELQLSDGIMSTSFWAQGTDKSNKTVRSIDLGNVGYDDRD